MRCPTCRRDLLVVEWRRIELDHCPTCRGTWFDADELGLLLSAIGLTGYEGTAELLALPPADVREKRVRCPRCDRRLRKVAAGGAASGAARDTAGGAASGATGETAGGAVPSAAGGVAGAPVVLDACPEGDGIWFDRGEVRALVEALAARGSEATSRLAEHLGEMFR